MCLNKFSTWQINRLLIDIQYIFLVLGLCCRYIQIILVKFLRNNGYKPDW
jgi:hypothetical protein